MDSIPSTPTWSRRRLCEAAGLAALAASAAPMLQGCGGKPAIRVKLAWIPSVEYAGLYMALAKGLCAAAGIAPKLVAGGPNSQVVPLVASGTALIGLEAVPENVVNAINSGAPLKIIGAQFQKSPECWVSLAKAPIRTPKDIEGKRLGVTLVGKNTALVFMRMNGVDTNKVTLVPIQYDPAPLVAGEIDALWGYAPNQPVALYLRGHPSHVMPLADHGFNRMQNVLFASRDALAEPAQAALVRTFLSTAVQGWALALRQPDEAVAVVMKQFGLSLGLDAKEQASILSVLSPFMARTEAPDKPQFWMGEALVAETVASLGHIGVKASSAMFTNEWLG